MQSLPTEIERKFFEFLDGEETVKNFEQWIYETEEIEKVLEAEDYIQLISLKFSRRDAVLEIDKILEKYIDYSRYETAKLKKLLTTFIKGEGDAAKILAECYTLYCNGYYFLDTLGLKYGLSVIVPANADSWQELSDEHKREWLHSCLPEAMTEAQKILTLLNTGEIVMTGNPDDRYRCLDRQTDQE